MTADEELAQRRRDRSPLTKAKEIFIGLGYVALINAVVIVVTFEVGLYTSHYHDYQGYWGLPATLAPLVIGLSLEGWLIARNWKARRLRAWGVIIGILMSPPALIVLFIAFVPLYPR